MKFTDHARRAFGVAAKNVALLAMIAAGSANAFVLTPPSGNTGKKLYWVNATPLIGGIWSANTDGSNMKLLALLGSNPDGIAVDTQRKLVYFTNMTLLDNNSGNLKVARINSDGSLAPAQDFVPDGYGLNEPKQLLLDRDNGVLYFADRATRKLYRAPAWSGAPIAPEQLEVLADFSALPAKASAFVGVALDKDPANPRRGWLYFTDRFTNAILRTWVNLDAGKFVSPLNSPPGRLNSATPGTLNWESETIYSNVRARGACKQAVGCVEIVLDYRDQFPMDNATGDKGMLLDLALDTTTSDGRKYLYFSDRGDGNEIIGTTFPAGFIGRIDLNRIDSKRRDGGMEKLVLDLACDPVGIALDGGYVYFSESETGAFYRAEKNQPKPPKGTSWRYGRTHVAGPFSEGMTRVDW